MTAATDLHISIAIAEHQAAALARLEHAEHHAWLYEDRLAEHRDDTRDDDIHDLLDDMAWEDGEGE